MRWQVAGLVVGMMLSFAPPCLARPLPMIQAVQYDPVSQRLVLTSTGDLVPQITQLTAPHRIVVDFPGQVLAPKQLSGWQPALKGVRLAQFQPETGRLVFDVDQPMTVEVERQRSSDGTVQVFFRLVGALRGDNHLQAIDVMGDELLLTTAKPVQPVLTQSGVRISLQLPQLKASGLAKVPVASGLFEHLSAVEDEDGVTLQATLHRAEPLTVSVSEGGRTISLKARAPWAKLAVAPKNDGQEASLVLQADRRFTYEIEREATRIQLTTTGTVADDMRRHFADGLIKSVQVSPGEGSGMTVIALETVRPAAYAVSLSEDGQTLRLTLKGEASRPGRRQEVPLIVLDAGHGGRDPGAIGPGGTREAHVTLAVTRFLEEELHAMGWQTTLARQDDSEIQLAPRVAVANGQQADLFVSIHCNALDRNWIKGIETYFHNPFSLGLAQAIHSSLVSRLGSPDRGVRNAKFYVINHTTMPAVLCEIGYLSNPDEEKKLADPAYQRQVAKAIAQGLRNYWDKSSAK